MRLGPEDLSPALVRDVVRQGGKGSFAEARVELQAQHDLEIQAKQVQRVTERVGEEWGAARDRDVEAFKQGKLGRAYAGVPPAAAVMVDAGRILTRAAEQAPGVHEPQWRAPRYACCLSLNTKEQAEDPQPEPPAKLLDRAGVPRLVRELSRRAGAAAEEPATCGAAAEGGPAKPKRKPRLTQRLVRTVVATMAGAEEFGHMAATETYRRGLDLAERKGYVCDGERANWTLFETHFRSWGFVPILDFLHLLPYLYGAAQAAGGDAKARWARYEQWLRWAWGGERERVWAELCAAAAAAGAPPDGAGEQDPRVILKKAAGYVEHNLERMNYPKYRKLGLPWSSAPVESVIKQFNRRLKGTEKFWVEAGAEAVLQVRAAYLSEDGRAERYWNMPRPRYRAVGRNRLSLVSAA